MKEPGAERLAIPQGGSQALQSGQAEDGLQKACWLERRGPAREPRKTGDIGPMGLMALASTPSPKGSLKL